MRIQFSAAVAKGDFILVTDAIAGFVGGNDVDGALEISLSIRDGIVKVLDFGIRQDAPMEIKFINEPIERIKNTTAYFNSTPIDADIAKV